MKEFDNIGIKQKIRSIVISEKGSYFSLAFGSFLLLIGIIFSNTLNSDIFYEKMFYTFITEFGFAFIIASILIWTIDGFQKQQHHLEIEKLEKQVRNRNLLAFLTGSNISPELSKKIEGHFKKDRPIRTTNIQTFKIDIIEDDDDFCEFININRFICLNDDDKTYKWIHEFYLDTPNNIPEKYKDASELIYYRVEVKESGADDFVMKDSQDLKGKGIRGARDLKSKTVNVPPQAEIRIEYRFRNIRKSEDAEPWQNMLLTESTELTIMYDKNVFEAEARWVHPIIWNQKTKDVPDGLRLETSLPLLPGNGVFVNWHRKPN